MPIEIRELIIKATVNDNQQQGSPTPAASTPDVGALTEQQKMEVVEQALAILKRQKER